jgi:hypothetical protein
MSRGCSTFNVTYLHSLFIFYETSCCRWNTKPSFELHRFQHLQICICFERLGSEGQGHKCLQRACLDFLTIFVRVWRSSNIPPLRVHWRSAMTLQETNRAVTAAVQNAWTPERQNATQGSVAAAVTENCTGRQQTVGCWIHTDVFTVNRYVFHDVDFINSS